MAHDEHLRKLAALDLARGSVAKVLVYPVVVLATAAVSGFFREHTAWVVGVSVLNLLPGLARSVVSQSVIKGRQNKSHIRALELSILAQSVAWAIYVISTVHFYGIGFPALINLLVSAAIAVAGWATLASAPWLLQTFVTILMLPSAIALFFRGGPALYAGLAYLVATGVFLATGKVQSDRYWKSIQDRLELEKARQELHQALDQAMRQKEELERKNAELENAKKLAEKASRTKSEFLAVMSHELRTPLNGVLGAVQVLLDDGLPPHQTEMANIIRSSGESLLTLISDILDLSKIESSRLELRQKRFALGPLVGETIALFARQAHDKGVRLSYRPATDMPTDVAGDSHRLKQVLSNLIGNALKFTQSGEVRVAARAYERRRRVLLHFSVADTGIGISQKHMGELFEAFTQVDSSLARRHGGAGVGLAVCTRLCAIMGGTVWVVSGDAVGGMPDESVEWDRTYEKGSIFHFTVLVEGVITKPSQPVNETAGQFAGIRVLLAEDNEFNQQIAMRFLQRLGCHVELAEDGQQVLDKLGKTQIDVVFMDLHMPVLDGLETTRRLREQFPKEKQPWVVALTASARAEDRERCLSSGMDDFVTKPIRRDELARSLTRAREAKGPERCC